MNSTKSKPMRSLLFSFAIVAAGCAGAKVTEQSSQASIAAHDPPRSSSTRLLSILPKSL